jgi:predicted Zn-ribbon and HTH transcriptional regulator
MPLDGLSTTPGQNFAPVKPLQDAKRTATNTDRNSSSVNAFFREIYQGHIEEHEPAWRESIEQGRIISLLRSGKLAMKADTISGGFVFFKPIAESKDRFNYPLFPQNCEILTSKWMKIRPLAAARHFGDGYKTDIQLKDLNTLVKSYFRDIFTTDYEVREAYSAQDYGIFITQFDYDDELNQMQALAPIFQNQSKVLVDGYGACYDCGFEGHPNDFAKTQAPMPQCPECQSYRTTKMVPDAVADEAVLTDVEHIVQGDICGRLREFPACRYDPRVFPHESNWFIYSERHPLRMIRKMFGADVEIDQNAADEIGFEVMDALSVRGGAIDGQGASDLWATYDRFSEEGTCRSMWLKPAEYAGFRLKEAEETLAGKIPAGVPFEDLFPDGLCVRGYNDMKLQTGIHGTKANLASNVYLYQSHSGIGKGIDSAVDSARDLNEVYTMAMAGLKRYGATGLQVDKDAGLTAQDIRNLFKPQKVVFFDTTNNGGDINKAVRKLEVNPINPVLPQMMIQTANMMNLAFMTGDFSQGQIQDVDINTFGGQQLAHAKAEEQKGGIFARKTTHRMQSAEIIVELCREHIKLPRWYAHGGDQHGTVRGKWLSGDELPPGPIKFDAVPDSEMPENKYEKRLAQGEMIEKAGGILALAQAAAADPKMTAWFTRGFGIELPQFNEEEIQLVTLARLNKVVELSEVYGDPQQIIGELRLRVREDAHVMKAEFLSRILDDDEVEMMNPVAQATIEAWIEQHYLLAAEAELRNETIKQQAMNQLAANQQQANQQIMGPQMQAEQQAAGDQANQQAMVQAAGEVGGRILDDEQAQVDADREEDAKNADEARNERVAQRDHDRQLELEKAKAKLKPAPAKPAARGK